MKSSQLRNRIIGYFIGFVVLLSLLFSALSFIFSYNIEDNLFRILLDDEQRHVEQQLTSGMTPKPRLEFIEYHQHVETLPEIIQRLSIEEPKRSEFASEDGKHYHLKRLDSGFLVAEVSEHLVVRKLKTEMFSLLGVLVVIGLAIAFVFAFAAFAVAKRMLRPLDSLMAIIDNAPVDKLPSGFSKQFSDNEIGRFAQTLEAALDRIKTFIARERQFTQDVSHELRTPLAITGGAVKLLQDSPLNDKQQTVLARIDHAQLQMSQSVEALLSLARENQIRPTQVKVLPIVEEIVLQLAYQIENKPIELDIQLKSSLVVNVQQADLKMILVNLIANAFTHTQSGIIGISYQDNHLIIRNTGIGIAAPVLERVFESGVKSATSPGLGIGLSIVKRLCERNNVLLNLDSDEQQTCVMLSFQGDA
ncbi:sensor histidine kinase [Pseudoalteromonas sp. T1lg65]|uniref:sensor histidine kinase n=1 Tax=Pseudoalteromonas sp. T1lg65 TaxID=2077101 RepID=UPI003F7ADB25